MAWYRCGGGGGVAGSSGTISVSTDTTYTIDTGLSSIESFVISGSGRSSGNAGTIILYDSRKSSSTLLQGGGGNILNKGSSFPLANGTNILGIVSISGGTVVVESATSDTTMQGTLYWSAVGTK